MSERDRSASDDELQPAFQLIAPLRQAVPFVFCSPHSGRAYPRSFLEASRLDAQALRKSEDCYVDELFGSVASLGAPLLAARFPRAYIDVNREPYELDPDYGGPEYETIGSLGSTCGVSDIVAVLGSLNIIAAELDR